MSNQYPGGFITRTPPAPSGPFQNSTAQGLWSLSQQAAYRKQGLWPTQGNVAPDTFVEGVFQSWLYTGNSSAQTIPNGLNLSANGGLVWIKGRSFASNHMWVDTVRGNTSYIRSSTTGAALTYTDALTSFNSNGFTLGADVANGDVNTSPNTYVSWAFAQKQKFFQIVTWIGDGTNFRQIPHNLGSAPGFIVTKQVSAVSNWWCYHRSLGNSTGIQLESDAPANTTLGTYPWNVTSTTFQVSSSYIGTNTNGVTYVAYVYAHDAGGFGLSGTDNIISCGSYVGNGSTDGPTVTLGYEPQWLLVKDTTSTRDWWVVDSMRGMFVGSPDWRLRPNTVDSDNNGDAFFAPTATGFKLETASFNVNASGNTYIYVAIRRGPMAVPTTGTSVFAPITASAPSGTVQTTGFPVDLQIQAWRDGLHTTRVLDRLRGVNTTSTESLSPFVATNDTGAESTGVPTITQSWDNTGFAVPSGNASIPFIWWNWRRAPGFMDEVCFTQTTTSSAQAVAHNLTVPPEFVITKIRNSGGYAGNTFPVALNNRLVLNETTAASTYGPLSSVTATSFSYPMADLGISIGTTYVAYLFATLPNVSKVGSFTGTGATQIINCGFTTGARFVLIKSTSASGSWYVWDSARGIVAGNDPYLLLNSTAAEIGGTDWVDTAATGFELSNAGGNLANSNGVSYIFLAIA
jgi:hypothetical protein